MSASPRVDFSKEICSLSTGDAPHENARGATFVHLAVDEDKSLGATSQSPCLGGV
jgi:hypothetical protein